jgi:Co/Zn/Cd efflux system component
MQSNSIMKEQEKEAVKGMRTLLFVAFMCFAFMIGEFVGGLLSHSLAILTDAAHQLSDVTGFLVSYFAVRIGKR